MLLGFFYSGALDLVALPTVSELLTVGLFFVVNSDDLRHLPCCIYLGKSGILELLATEITHVVSLNFGDIRDMTVFLEVLSKP